MGYDDLVGLAQQALLLSVAVSLPVVVAAALVGLLMSALQALTQVGDTTVSHLPRFLVVAFVLVMLGPWMGREILAFAARAFTAAS